MTTEQSMKLVAEMQQASKSDSCLTDISSRPNVAKDRVIINVGGCRHETYLSTLRVVPDSRLAWIAENASKQAEYDQENNEYFFDRHPSVFASILNYYRTGKLHCPSDVCGPLFEEELTFWGIDELQMEPCCWSNYTQHRDAQATLKAFEGLQKDSGDSETENSNMFVDPNAPRMENLKKQTWAMLELPYSSKYAQIYAFVSLLVIVLSVATFCIESMFPKNEYKAVFDALEYFYCIVFTLEFVARLATCPNRVKFFKEAMTWVDMLSIMPLYIRFADPNTTLDFLFVLRLVRIFRLFRFFRTMSGMQVIGHTLRASARELFLLILILLIPMVIFSTLVFYAEKASLEETERKYFKNIPESFWWAVITMTTVGYGDVYPESHLGRLIGTVCACVGVLIVALPVSVIGSNFTLFYSHAQAQLKLPKKKKKPVLLGAAGVLVSETSLYGNDEERTEPITLPPEIHLSVHRRSARNPSITPRKKAGNLNIEETVSNLPSPIPTPVHRNFTASVVSAESIAMSDSDHSNKPSIEMLNSNRTSCTVSSETCISNGLRSVGDDIVHLTTQLQRRMAISPLSTPPLRRHSQKRKKKPGRKTTHSQEGASFLANDKNGCNTTDVDSHLSCDSRGSLVGESSANYNPRAKATLSPDEDESLEKTKDNTESIPLLRIGRSKPCDKPTLLINRNRNPQMRAKGKSGKRLLPTLSPTKLRGRQPTDTPPPTRRSTIITGQRKFRPKELNKSASEGNMSQYANDLSQAEQCGNQNQSSTDIFPCNGDLNGIKDSNNDQNKTHFLANTQVSSPDGRHVQRTNPNSDEFYDCCRTNEDKASNSNDYSNNNRVMILGTGISLKEEQV